MRQYVAVSDLVSLVQDQGLVEAYTKMAFIVFYLFFLYMLMGILWGFAGGQKSLLLAMAGLLA